MKIERLFKIIKDNRELRLYIIWGIIAAILNILMFRMLVMLGLNYRISNIITLCTIRIFCYITNKLWVFKSKTESVRQLVKEIVLFFMARMITFLIDYIGVVVLVEKIRMDSLISKMIMAFLVIVFNYVFSKFWVFKKKRESWAI